MSKILTATFLYNGEKKVLKARLADSEHELVDCKMNENIELDTWTCEPHLNYYSLYFFGENEDFEIIGLYDEDYNISKRYDIKTWTDDTDGDRDVYDYLPQENKISFTIK